MSVPISVEADRATNPPPVREPVQQPARVSTAVKSSVTFLVFIAIFGALSLWLGDAFVNAQSRIFDFHQNVPLILLAFSAVVVLSVGQFDLSIGATATLTAYLSLGLFADQGLPMPVSLAICLAVGALAGLFNALLVVRMEINVFIATIGTGGIILGLSRVYGGGTVLVPEDVPSWFAGRESLASFATKVPAVVMWAALAAVLAMAGLRLLRTLRDPSRSRAAASLEAGVLVLGAVVAAAVWPNLIDLVPLTVLFAIAVSVVLWLMFTRTVFGRYLHATGSNPRAARLAGVKVAHQTTAAFVLTGVLAASAGIVLAANQGTATVDAGQPSLLPAYAAAFLSTVLLSSGRLHVWGCLLGAVFIVWIRQALIIGGIPFTWAEVVNGGVLVAAVAASRLMLRGERT